MCGISGIFSLNNISNISDRINSMNNSISHRGPDNKGSSIISNKKALGHRRLSIIDLKSVSNQPMFSNSGDLQLVFNGEIYNYLEIKKKLNYNFKTNSDSEVILASVEEKGINWFLDNANGMFAFAIYNKKTKNLILARDRMGIKPLFYFFDKKTLIFCSEIKGILNSGLVDAIFNDFAIDEYLANRYVREPYTFFKNIFQLKSGTYLEINENFDLHEKHYWSLPSIFNFDLKYDEKNIEIEFEEKLLNAIKLRLVSDVELGTYLSGGVDSSLITAISKKFKKGILNTYTIGFNDLNEFNYAKIVSDVHNTEHHEIILESKEYISNWERLIYMKDSPLGVPNEIPLAIMSEKLKKKITVVLSGEGADELMGGYGKIFRSPFDFENHNNSKNKFYDYFIQKYEYVPREIRNEFLNSSFKYRYEFDEINSECFRTCKKEESIFRFFHKYHVKGLLQRVDMTTMQTSVEARVPFLDHKLIEFSYQNIPYELKLKWNSENALINAKKTNAESYSEVLDTPKYLLRKIANKYLPDEIVHRKKVGFPVPLTKWFNNLEKIAVDRLENAIWLKKSSLDQLLKSCKEQNRSGQILWMFTNIEIFKDKYFLKNWRW